MIKPCMQVFGILEVTFAILVLYIAWASSRTGDCCKTCLSDVMVLRLTEVLNHTIQSYLFHFYELAGYASRPA